MRKHATFPVVMHSLALGTAGVTLILAILCRICRTEWLISAAISFGTAAYHFCMRLAVGYLVPKLPLNPRHPWFLPRSWEPGLYRALRVKRWKGKLPTYDPGQFSLKAQTREQIIRNMCVAELVHEGIVLLSFVPIAFSSVFGAFPVFLITSLLSALFDSLFVIIQRCNRPRLMRIFQKQSPSA